MWSVCPYYARYPVNGRKRAFMTASYFEPNRRRAAIWFKERRELLAQRIGIGNLNTTIGNDEVYEKNIDESAEINTGNVNEVCTASDENRLEKNEVGEETKSSINTNDDIVSESADVKSDIEESIEVEENVAVT